MRTGLLVIGHGSRQCGANAEFEACVAAVRQRHPEACVAPAYLEFAHPTLPQGLAALAARCSTVVALPVFLFAAGHVRRDIPEALRQARALHPQVTFVQAPCLGAHPALARLAWLRGAAALPPGANLQRTAWVAVGRGASDRAARADFCGIAQAVVAPRGLASMQVSFIGLASPQVETVLEATAATQPERLVVAPYFLFAGRLLTDLHGRVAAFAAHHPGLPVHVAGPLGAHTLLFAALEDRLQQGLTRSIPATKPAHPANIEQEPLR